MFYETRENKHGLRHDPFKALAVPRPIGWISTVDKNGVCNIAPYSFFNAIGERPHYVMFSSAGPRLAAQHRGNRRVRVLARHLGSALQHEHDVGLGAPRRR